MISLQAVPSQACQEQEGAFYSNKLIELIIIHSQTERQLCVCHPRLARVTEGHVNVICGSLIPGTEGELGTDEHCAIICFTVGHVQIVKEYGERMS